MGLKRVQKAQGEDLPGVSKMGREQIEQQTETKLFRDRPEIKRMRERFYEGREKMLSQPKSPEQIAKENRAMRNRR